MKRALNQMFVIGVLLAVMLGLEQLRAGTGTPLTLAAIGFVVLVAFTFAELGSSLTLPKVTGYIVAGIALGPYAGDILSKDVVKDMGMFKDLALGLIATSAGLELDGKAILRMWKGLTATVALKVLLLPVLVGGTFIAVQTVWAPLPLPSFDATLGLAIIFSALAVGTSPAIALAVLSETGAKGKLSDLTLGLSVLKDAVVVVCLAVALAVALSLTSPDASLEPALLLKVGKHLGEEVLLGLGLALLLVAYMRFVGAEMLLFVGAMILVVTHVSTALHLQPLLTFIVAGFIVRNFTPYEHTLLHPLEVVALPVFVVFFTNAGASVDLGATLEILPLALALCAARAVAFYVAGRFGAAAGGEAPTVQRAAWLAYLPQAGVTLGLVGLAGFALPDLETPIVSTGMAVVAINLLVGPITLRLALRRVGELPNSIKTTADDPVDVAPGAAPGPAPRPPTGDPDLDQQLDALEAALGQHVDAFVASTLEGWSKSQAEALATALPKAGDPPSLSALRRWADATDQPDAQQHAARMEELFETLRTELRGLPVDHDAPLPDHVLHGQHGDGVWLRLRKLGARTFRVITRGPPRRRVLLRMAARTALEPEVAPALQESLGIWLRTEATLYADLRQLVEGNRSVAEVREGAAGLLERWVPQWREGMDQALQEGMTRLATWASHAGTVHLSDKRLRFSRVEPSITRSLAELERSGRQWAPRLCAARRTVRLTVEIEALQRHTEAEVAKGFLKPLATMLEVTVPEVQQTRDRLAAVAEQLAAVEVLDERALEEAATGCRRAFSQEAHRTLKQRRAELRDMVVENRLMTMLKTTVSELPEGLSALGGATPLQFARSPLDTELMQVPMRRICEEALLVDFLPQLEGRVRQAHAMVNVLNSQLREHVGVATFAIELARSGEEEGGDLKALVDDGLTRALRRVDELLEKLVHARDTTPTQLSDGLARAFAAVRTNAARARVEVAERRTVLYSTRRALARGSDRLAGVVGRLRSHSRNLWRRLRASDLSTELQRRASRTRLDATGLRERLHGDQRSAEQPELPPMYGRLFSLEPLHDRRFFASARPELKQLLAAEQCALEGHGDGGLLVVGAHGTGRTSLLNVAQSEFRAPRVLRLGDEHDHRDGLLAALASELQCEPRPGEVRATLATERTAIVVDDLESWCSPDLDGLRDLAEILDLVVSTRHVAFWAVSISDDALALVDPMVAVRQAFGQVVPLVSLDVEGLARVVEARNRVSGLSIEYPPGRWARVLGQRRADAGRYSYYRNLQRTSGGNLRAAVRAWHRDIAPSGNDAVMPVLRSHVLNRGRFLDQLHPHAVGLVVQVVRFGATDIETLARTLALSRAEVGRHVAFLRTAGILETRPGLQGGLRLAPAVQPTVCDALIEFGALIRRDR